jgi:hypothetical protein
LLSSSYYLSPFFLSFLLTASLRMPEEGGSEVVRRMEKKEREVVRRRIERKEGERMTQRKEGER